MNLIVIIIAVILIMAIMNSSSSMGEQFSSGGLNMSNRYCNKLVHTYYKPGLTNEECRHKSQCRICGRGRRHVIDFPTSNYYTRGGVLV